MIFESVSRRAFDQHAVVAMLSLEIRTTARAILAADGRPHSSERSRTSCLLRMALPVRGYVSERFYIESLSDVWE